MAKTVVAVLFGGASLEHEVSMRSAAYVVPAIPLDRYDVLPVYINKEGQWFLYDGSLDNFSNILWEQFGTPAILSPDTKQKGLLRMVGDKFQLIPVDVIFPLIHGENGEDGSIQGLCQLASLPVVGSGVIGSAVSMDKSIANCLAASIGVKQAPFLTFAHVRHFNVDEWDEMLKKIRYSIGYPCFVKPAAAGSSVGVSKATNKKTLEQAIKNAMEVDSKIIVEKAIMGRELEVSVVGNKDPQVSSVGEILVDTGFYDYDAKYIKEIPTDLYPNLPEGVEAKIRAIAKEVFLVLDGRGYARVDFFLEETTNQVYFNEMNTIPGFTSISMFPKLCMKEGYSFSQIVNRLIELAKEDFYE